MKKNKSTAILILVFFVGLSLLLYPTISDYWNSFHSSKAIATYAAEVAKLDPISYDQIWEEARTYNKMLAEKRNKYILSEEEYAAYEKLLDITGTGIMAEIEIPSVRVDLPVYHGMDESVLQVAAEHKYTGKHRQNHHQNTAQHCIFYNFTLQFCYFLYSTLYPTPRTVLIISPPFSSFWRSVLICISIVRLSPT